MDEVDCVGGGVPKISCSSMGSSSRSELSSSESEERKSAGLGTAAKIPDV